MGDTSYPLVSLLLDLIRQRDLIWIRLGELKNKPDAIYKAEQFLQHDFVSYLEEHFGKFE